MIASNNIDKLTKMMYASEKRTSQLDELIFKLSTIREMAEDAIFEHVSDPMLIELIIEELQSLVDYAREERNSEIYDDKESESI